jgi:hypothetical protein
MHKEHYHQDCVEEKELKDVKIGGSVGNDKTLSACGCCLENGDVKNQVLSGKAELKFGISVNDDQTGCPSIDDLIYEEVIRDCDSFLGWKDFQPRKLSRSRMRAYNLACRLVMKIESYV